MRDTLRTVDRSTIAVGLVGLLLVSGVSCKQLQPLSRPTPLRLQTVVAVDGEGNQVVTGPFSGRIEIEGVNLVSAGGTDIFLAKARRDGTPVYPPQRFGGKGNDAATGVAIDTDGSVVIAGTTQLEATFGDQVLKPKVRHPDQLVAFIARVDAIGKVRWIKQLAVVNVPTQVSVAIGPAQTIVVGASVIGTVDKEGHAMHSAGESVVLDVLDANGESTKPPPAMGFRAFSLVEGCSHSPCAVGGRLVAGCGPDDCVAWICNDAPECCNIAWTSDCASMVATTCFRRCECKDACTQGNPIYAGACPCVGQVCNDDDYCGLVRWDGLCVTEGWSLCGCQ